MNRNLQFACEREKVNFHIIASLLASQNTCTIRLFSDSFLSPTDHYHHIRHRLRSTVVVEVVRESDDTSEYESAMCSRKD